MMADTLEEWLQNEQDEGVLDYLAYFLLGAGLLLVVLDFLKIQVPYGKYRNSKDLVSRLLLTNVKIPAKVSWFLMEAPSFVIPLYLVFHVGGKHVGQFNPNIVLLGMFLLHYFNRVFVFSFIIKGNPVPIFSPLAAFLFTSINGYLQGRYFTQYLTYDLWWFADPRFIVGHIVFLVGMATNIHSDAILRGLRKPGEKGYKIPCGGLFEYVSGANYFAECVEWVGYAIATWSWPGLVMATFTIAFLGPRALQYHRYYKQKFEDYPKNRTAFIPFLL